MSCPILGSSPRTSLGVQPLDLPLMRRLRVRPDAKIEGPRRLILRLLLAQA